MPHTGQPPGTVAVRVRVGAGPGVRAVVGAGVVGAAVVKAGAVAGGGVAGT